jgi:hypothetical protein
MPIWLVVEANMPVYCGDEEPWLLDEVGSWVLFDSPTVGQESL